MGNTSVQTVYGQALYKCHIAKETKEVGKELKKKESR